MDLRPELLPPPADQQHLEHLSREIERISDLLATGRPADEAITSFNSSTGHQYGRSDFAEYHGWRDLEDFALEAARPAYPRVPDITRDELIETVRRVLAADSDSDYYLRLLQANVTYPGVHDLIYHPPPELTEASPADIVDRALSHRSIAL
ncbi:hypothetical protein [Actinomadura sp. 9N407]|uniref:hypothetical protein n=1 Tax=Actinomadura sp. 9N407 TaxID=3375154 RepID=UPI0037A1C6B3